MIERINWKCVMVCGVLLFALWSVAAQARDPDGRYANSPNAAWFKSQHNSEGQWCCDQSDGHFYDGNYSFNPDGSVTVEMDGKPHKIEKSKVLTGPNPTGRAVWWFVTTEWGHRDYCFAPGTLS